MLKIRHFSKLYDNKPAVDDLSLEVNAGDIYAFIGHNGAGKTTTIKACCGILQFEQGDIFVNGLSVKDSPIECKKQMAYIPRQPRALRVPFRHKIFKLRCGYLRCGQS